MKKKSWLRNIICIICLVVLIAIPLCLLIARLHENHKKEELIAFARDTVTKYISDKYNFEVDSIELSHDKYTSQFHNDEGIFEFKVTYNDSYFYSLFVPEQDTYKCYDDYQWEEIYSAAEQSFSQHFPQGAIIDMKFYGLGSPRLYLMDDKHYFDGSDIISFLQGCDGYVKMAFYDASFSQDEITDIIPVENIDIEFASFDTKEHRDEFLGCIDKSAIVFTTYLYESLEKYAPHLIDYIKIENGNYQGYNISVQKCDEFEYAYFPVELNSITLETQDNIQPIKCAKPSKLIEVYTNYYDEGKWLGRPLSDEYYFDSIFGDIWIYYPLEKLEGYDLNSVGLAWFSASGISNNRNICKAEICGDYAVFHMPFGEDYFMFVDISGYDEYIPDYSK